MSQYLIKVLLTSLLVVAIAEIAKRSTLMGAVLASLPLTSILAIIWLYTDTSDVARVADLARSIFWLVLPSLALFLVLPAALKAGWGFWPSLAAGCAASAAGYGATLWALRAAGVRF